MFPEGIKLWIDSYESGENYYKYEADLWRSLLRCFGKIAKKKGLSSVEIRQEQNIVGNTRVDFLLEKEVSFEVKFEPDYPGMPSTRKPVTNVVLKVPDKEVARYAGLKGEAAKRRIYEVELDFLKLMAHKKRGIPHNYLLCLDEDGRLHRNLARSFRTSLVKDLAISWKSITRGIDHQKVYYFLWKA